MNNTSMFLFMTSNIEGRIALAIQALHSGQCKSIRAASRAFHVPYTTLNERYHGILSRQDTRPATSKLSQTEEEVLLQRILDLDA